jgi:hypothetical protein
MATLKHPWGEHLRTPVGFHWAKRGVITTRPTLDDKVVLLGAGDATTRLSVGTNADKRFFDFYTESAALSGDSRGIYWQHFLSGAGATGDCARFFCKVNATGVAGGFGLHATLQIQDDATTGITGLAVGARATLAAEADTRTLGGTLAALQVDSDIGANNTLGGNTAFIRIADNNSVKIPNFLHFAAGTVVANTTETAATQAGSIKVNVAGTTKYIALYTASS